MEQQYQSLAGIAFKSAPMSQLFSQQLEAALQTYQLPSNAAKVKAATKLGRAMGNRNNSKTDTTTIRIARAYCKNVIEEMEKYENSLFVGIDKPDDAIRYVNISPNANLSSFQLVDAILNESERIGTCFGIKKLVDIANEFDQLLPNEKLISTQNKEAFRVRGGYALFNTTDQPAKMKAGDVLVGEKNFPCPSGDPGDIYEWSLKQIGVAIDLEKPILYGEGMECHEIPELRFLVQKHNLLDLWTLSGVFGEAQVPGLTEPMVYCGSTLSAFGAHLEDVNAPSVIQVIRGTKIIGLIAPGSDVNKFLALMTSSIPKLKCGSPLQHRYMLPERYFLAENGVNCTFHAITTGVTFIIPPGHIHFGVNVGHTISISVNVGATSWFKNLPKWVTENDKETVLSKKTHEHSGFEKSHASCKSCKNNFRRIIKALQFKKMKCAAQQIPRYKATFIYGKITPGSGKYRAKVKDPFETQESVPATTAS